MKREESAYSLPVSFCLTLPLNIPRNLNEEFPANQLCCKHKSVLTSIVLFTCFCRLGRANISFSSTYFFLECTFSLATPSKRWPNLPGSNSYAMRLALASSKTSPPSASRTCSLATRSSCADLTSQEQRARCTMRARWASFSPANCNISSTRSSLPTTVHVWRMRVLS